MSKKTNLVAGLICGNEEARIERCVKSLFQICDDIVIIRAIGAQKPDETLKIAKKLGCHTGHYFNEPLCANWPHLDNFGRARNQAFEMAYDLAGKDGWVMWADCDDVIPEHMAEPHLKALRDCPAECDWILTDYVIPEQNKRAPRERFFRYKTAWWWRPVHENAHPTKEIKIHLRRDLEIVHQPPLGRRPSNERNTRILLWNDQFSPHFKFYLHYELMIQGHREKALRYGAEAIALKGLDPIHRYETLINLANMSDAQTALTFADKAIELDSQRREALALKANILLDLNKPKESLEIINRMESVQVPKFPQWTHKAEYYGWKATRLRAWAERMMGNGEKAFELEQGILKAAPRPRISLLHATYGRPIQAASTMSQWLSRAAKPERIEHIFAVDHDDPTAEHLQRFGGVVQTERGYSVGAWNLAAQHATGDILVQLSDDWECPPGWDEMLVERLDYEKPQVLRISDGYRKDELLCMAILTRPYYDAAGLFDPRFHNVYSDTDFTLRAAKNGVIIDAKDICFVHHHPFWEGRELDPTYERGNNPAEYERAKALFESIHKP